MSVKSIRLGCDPEVFVLALKTGEVVPVCGLIGGTKKEPLDVGKGIKVQEDNVTLEFNIEPVVHEFDSDALFEAVSHALGYIDNNILSPKGLTYSTDYNCYEFKEKQLVDPKCHVFGCDPDLNAYLQGMQNTPIDSKDFGLKRCAGGHIHVEVPEGCPIPPWAMVQLCEALVIYPYAARHSFNIIGKERVKMYGKAGAYRVKPYGFEYRTPSNLWCFRNDAIARRIGNVVLWAVNNPDKARNLYDSINFNTIQYEINHNAIGGSYHPFLKDMYDKHIGSGSAPAAEEGFNLRIDAAAPQVLNPFRRGEAGAVPQAAPRMRFADMQALAPDGADIRRRFDQLVERLDANAIPPRN